MNLAGFRQFLAEQVSPVLITCSRRGTLVARGVVSMNPAEASGIIPGLAPVCGMLPQL